MSDHNPISQEHLHDSRYGLIFTKYLKEVLTLLLLASMGWIGNNMTEANKSIVKIQTDVSYLSANVSELKEKMEMAISNRFTSIQGDELRDLIHDLDRRLTENDKDDISAHQKFHGFISDFYRNGGKEKYPK